MSLRARLDRLETVAGAEGGWSDYVKPSDDELLSDFEDVYQLTRGSVSRTSEEATAKGYNCVAAEMAAAVGLTLAEFKRQLKDVAAGDDGREFRWIGNAFPKRCQIREVRQ